MAFLLILKISRILNKLYIWKVNAIAFHRKVWWIKNYSFRSGNTKGSCFPASFGGRCSGTPPECQDCNKVKNCEKSLEPRGQPQPLCECINPFVGTRNAYRGDSDALCGSGGPGFCYVPCNADCSDIQPTSSASRCQSANACDVQQGIKLLSANPIVRK